MKKIVFIIDSSDAFIDFQKDLILESWKAEDIQKVTNLSSVGNQTLFGPTPVAILKLEDSDQVKKVLKEVQELVKEGALESKCANGLIITSSLNKNSTRSLLKALEPYAEIRMGDGNLTETLVKDYMHLNKEAEEFLLNYLGQDYGAAIPLARSIGKLPIEKQQKISIDSLYYRLPKPKGGVPPWDIEKPLFAGDVDNTIDKYRRSTVGAAPLLPIFILNKKLRLVYKCAVLLEEKPKISNKEISEILKAPNNYPLRLAVEKARALGTKKSEELVLLLADVEKDLKGGSGVPGDALVETTLLKMIKILGS